MVLRNILSVHKQSLKTVIKLAFQTYSSQVFCQLLEVPTLGMKYLNSVT